MVESGRAGGSMHTVREARRSRPHRDGRARARSATLPRRARTSCCPKGARRAATSTTCWSPSGWRPNRPARARPTDRSALSAVGRGGARRLRMEPSDRRRPGPTERMRRGDRVGRVVRAAGGRGDPPVRRSLRTMWAIVTAAHRRRSRRFVVKPARTARRMSYRGTRDRAGRQHDSPDRSRVSPRRPATPTSATSARSCSGPPSRE